MIFVITILSWQWHSIAIVSINKNDDILRNKIKKRWWMKIFELYHITRLSDNNDIQGLYSSECHYWLKVSSHVNQTEKARRFKSKKIFRTIHQWFDVRNVEIENLPKYKSISKLTDTNPSIIEDFLQHKLSIVYLQEYLSNPGLSTERRRILKNVRKFLIEGRLSLFDHILCYHSWKSFSL